MPNPLVVHCKRSKYDVYIGRAAGPRGKWGNPFSHDDQSSAPIQVASRAAAILCYRQWINGGQQKAHERLKLVRPTIDEIKSELKGKILGCWCSPLACHGDVLVEIANS